MACGCSKRKESSDSRERQYEMPPAKIQSLKTTPTEQCIYCAGKHLAEAWECWHEQGYRQEDLRHIQGALRAIVLHTFSKWSGISKMARDCAVTLQHADFGTFDRQLATLCDLYDEAFAKEEPEVQRRIDMAREDCDIVIPLGPGSAYENMELRFLLRSIEENASGVGRVIVVSTCAPEWLSANVEVLKVPDELGDNKDGNLLKKTIRAIETYGIRNMTWCADDNIFLQPTRLSTIPTIVNNRTRDVFKSKGGRWAARVMSTFDWADGRGVHLDHSLESHCPQTFLGADQLPALMKDVDYVAQPITIMTCFHVLLGTWDGNIYGKEWQQVVKDTYEMPTGAFTPPTKRFVGYGDDGYADGLGSWLRTRFSKKSRYER